MDIELPEVRNGVWKNIREPHENSLLCRRDDGETIYKRKNKKLWRDNKSEKQKVLPTTNDDADQQSTKSKHKLHAAGNRIIYYRSCWSFVIYDC